jgi:hypothetical protein
MSTFDVTKGEQEAITEIQWSHDDDYNLVKSRNEVTIKTQGCHDMAVDGTAMITDVEEAENLIKAIQKAIDLGWFQ